MQDTTHPFHFKVTYASIKEFKSAIPGEVGDILVRYITQEVQSFWKIVFRYPPTYIVLDHVPTPDPEQITSCRSLFAVEALNSGKYNHIPIVDEQEHSIYFPFSQFNYVKPASKAA